MNISRDEVAKVSLLARLELSGAELDEMANQLSQIVSYVDQLAEVDTETVEPMAHAMDLANIFEADVEQESLTRDEALANAPQADDECFLAPAVFGDR